MNININVKVKGGKRTPVEVETYCTSVNVKIIRFKNGKEITDAQIADWIKSNLTQILKDIQGTI